MQKQEFMFMNWDDSRTVEQSDGRTVEQSDRPTVRQSLYMNAICRTFSLQPSAFYPCHSRRRMRPSSIAVTTPRRLMVSTTSSRSGSPVLTTGRFVKTV